MVEQQGLDDSLQQVHPEIEPSDVSQFMRDNCLEYLGGHFCQPGCGQQHHRSPDPRDKRLADFARQPKSWRDDQVAEDRNTSHDQLVRVEGVYLDRYPVTNHQYQKFVDDGGYEQMSIWDRNIWPAVLDFVDRTGHSGPRFWSDGRYPDGLKDHPVVGVSWYEAVAYSRWVGKRLPSDPEWVKAGSWARA